MSFPRDYFSARDNFRRLAELRGWNLQSYVQDARGPQDEELTIDVASIGAANAANVLLVSSGTHGVEGYLGSAVQCSTIESSPTWASKANDVRLVYVHALNPYAYAWSRRCDRNNVDPNRNFLVDGDEYTGSHATYRSLQRWLNPRRAMPWWDPLHLKAAWTTYRLGMPSVKEAIAGGQFDFPKGLFYGGAGPSDVFRFLQLHLGEWVQNASRVLHLDIHTGLGPWASCKLLIDEFLSPAQAKWLAGVFGDSLIQQCVPQGVAYRFRGAMGRWCESWRSNLDYSYVCAEFGTYSLQRVLFGLRAENQAHHWQNYFSKSARRARQRMIEMFCPKSIEWRERTLGRGIALVHIAAQALSQEKSGARGVLANGMG